MFGLLYTPYGGSGLGLTVADIMDMEFDVLLWLRHRLSQERERERRQLRGEED